MVIFINELVCRDFGEVFLRITWKNYFRSSKFYFLVYVEIVEKINEVNDFKYLGSLFILKRELNVFIFRVVGIYFKIFLEVYLFFSKVV